MECLGLGSGLTDKCTINPAIVLVQTAILAATPASPTHHAMPPTTLSDTDLIARTQGGDAGAFRLLVERYESQVAATVIGMLGHTPEADEVGQETFVRFYRSLDRFRGDAAVGTYLTRIAINASLTALERRKKRRLRFLRRDDLEQMPTPAIEGGRDLAAKEQQALVQSAIRKLKPDHRAVVVLRMLNEYSTQETAALLNIPPGTVMSRLKRALDNLKTLLAPHLDATDLGGAI